MLYFVNNAMYDGVYEANSSHKHQTQKKEVGIAVQLEVCGFGIQDGADQLALGCAVTWANRKGPSVADYDRSTTYKRALENTHPPVRTTTALTSSSV